MQIDHRDQFILTRLQTDCRLSNAELAEAVGMSASALWRRIRALEEAGVIERYGAVVNPARMGLGFHAIVHVQLTRHDRDRVIGFIRAVESRAEVQECHATTGQSDYHLRVLCRDLEIKLAAEETTRFFEDEAISVADGYPSDPSNPLYPR